MVIIGIDAHKRTHTVFVLDRQGRPGIGGAEIPRVGDTTAISRHAGRSYDHAAGRTTDTSHEGN